MTGEKKASELSMSYFVSLISSYQDFSLDTSGARLGVWGGFVVLHIV